MFPNFNIYSSPLLILVIQGVILALLIFRKYLSVRNVSYLLLSILLLITCYHRTTYTIGFLGWYDTFRNTKINYYLISLGLSIGPLIYLYLKSCIFSNYKFLIKEWLHFIPSALYVLFKLFILAFDSQQSGFESTQNGPLYLWVMENLGIIISSGFIIHLLIYLVYTLRLYFGFRKELEQEYSNTYRYELLWLRNFLYLFTFLFVYDTLQSITDGFIFQLHWTQEWWYQFFSLLVVIYVGIKGFFTPTEYLSTISADNPIARREPTEKLSPKAFKYNAELERLKDTITDEQMYLDPNLSLSLLSRKIKINTTQLSHIINVGTGKNFNEFINDFRVDKVKAQLSDPSKKHLSILAIAFDAGFNSKATFNRVFKKTTGFSPTEFRK